MTNLPARFAALSLLAVGLCLAGAVLLHPEILAGIGAQGNHLIALIILTLSVLGAFGLLIWQQHTAQSDFEMLGRILYNSPHMLISVDANGTVTSFNRASEMLLGYKASEVIGRQSPLLWHDQSEIAERAAQLSDELGRTVTSGFAVFVTKALQNGTDTREWTFIHRDGARLMMSLTVVPLYSTRGDLTGFVGSIIDGRAHRAAEDAKQSSEEKLQAVIDGAPNGILVTDSRGQIKTANPALARIFGYEEGEIINCPITMLIPRSYHQQHDKDVAGFMSSGQRRQMAAGKDVVGQRKNGTIVPVEVGLSRISLPGGEVNIIATVQDISARKQEEDQKQKLLEKLTASNSELERFAYITSHDMQEPIRMINSFCGVIRHDYGQAFDETGQQYLNMVINSAERLSDLVDDLLTYSRLGNSMPAMNHFDGQTLIDNVRENLQALLQERQVEILFGPPLPLYGNAIQISRLLQNLIINAIKYQPAGNTPKIEIAFEDHEDVWHISVKDNGLGIREEFHEQIFQPFRRLHTWDEIQGTGLGLSICRKIAESHAGRLWVNSRPGAGSTFTFSLKKPVPDTRETA